MSDENQIEKETEKSVEQSADFDVQKWQIVHVKTRIDAINQADFAGEIDGLFAKGALLIGLDLRHNRFLCVPAIKLCVDTAHKLAEKGGTLALIACSEKTKRYFEIYGSLGPIRLVRSESDLAVRGRPKQISI